MNAREVSEIARLIQEIKIAIPQSRNSIIHYQFEGMEMALQLMLLMASDRAEFDREKSKLFAPSNYA